MDSRVSKAADKSFVFSLPLTTMLSAWLIAGTLDMSGALIVWSVILKKISATQILQGIASGVLGKEAFNGGPPVLLLGVCIHYFNAFVFTLLYFIAARYISFLRKQPIISGLLYGIFVWAFMNYIVLPLSFVHQSPFKWSNALISIGILMVCIGLPLGVIAGKYYESSRRGHLKNT